MHASVQRSHLPWLDPYWFPSPIFAPDDDGDEPDDDDAPPPHSSRCPSGYSGIFRRTSTTPPPSGMDWKERDVEDVFILSLARERFPIRKDERIMRPVWDPIERKKSEMDPAGCRWGDIRKRNGSKFWGEKWNETIYWCSDWKMFFSLVSGQTGSMTR